MPTIEVAGAVSLSVLPWLKMITASAPASSALRDLLAKPHRAALDQGDVAVAAEVEAGEVVGGAATARWRGHR